MAIFTKILKRVWFPLVLLFILCHTSFAQTIGSMTDSRNGQTYTTMSFENALFGSAITWMAENLNYKIDGSYAYDSLEKFREGVGLLYTWEAANIACPSGWHLASDMEWDLLVNQFGGKKKAGIALKSGRGWNDGGSGINSSGFTSLPGGFRYSNGNFVKLGEYGYWWTSTTANKGTAWMREMYKGNSKIGRDADYKTSAFSCRCVKDW